MKNMRKSLEKFLNSFKSQRGDMGISLLLTGFTIAGLLLAGGSAYVNYKNKIDVEDAVKIVRESAEDLKRKQDDSDINKARIKALEYMADGMERHKDFNYNRKMLKTALDLGINLIPGQLPLAKGTKEAIEMVKNIYDTNNAINDSFGDRPEKPSKEMVDFYKILSKGKISPSALEAAMFNAEVHAVNEDLDKLLDDWEKLQSWKKGQRELLDDYRRRFIKNSIQSSLEELERTGRVSTHYRDLWGREGFKKELSKYPQIVDALKEDDRYVPATDEEKEKQDMLVLDLMSQNELMKKLMGEDEEPDLGNWEERADKLMEKLEELVEEDTGGENDESEVEVEEKKEGGFFDGIKRIWRGGTHNSFSFESDGSSIKYEAVRYDGWSIGKGSIDNVQPNSFVSHTGSLFNQYNTAIVVYVSTNGNLYYKVISPYAVSGKERSYIGTIYSGMLARDVGSIDVSKLRMVRRGKYGLEVKWVNNQDETYQAEINQFHGVVKKEKTDSKSVVAGQVTAVGRLLPCPDYNSKGPCQSDLEYLERMADQVRTEYVASVHVDENQNFLEMTFPRQGGKVSGSFVWEFNIVAQSKSFEGAGGVTSNINHWNGNFTGDYSGGKKGNFKGEFDGGISFSEGGGTASFTGTWEASIKADGTIEGMFYYTIVHSFGGRVDDQIAFRAAVE